MTLKGATPILPSNAKPASGQMQRMKIAIPSVHSTKAAPKQRVILPSVPIPQPEISGKPETVDEKVTFIRFAGLVFEMEIGLGVYVDFMINFP